MSTKKSSGKIPANALNANTQVLMMASGVKLKQQDRLTDRERLTESAQLKELEKRFRERG